MTADKRDEDETRTESRRLPETSGGSGRTKNPTSPDSESLLPPAGPAWAGSLMGTFGAVILAAALGDWAGGLGILGRSFEWVFTIIGTIAFACMTVSWIRHRVPGFSQESMPAWAMTGMATALAGSAWATVTGSWIPYALTWLPALVICVGALMRFLPRLIKPVPFLGLLPTVAPVVPATAAAKWATDGDLPDALSHFLRIATVALVVLALVFALPSIVRAYGLFLPGGPPVDAAGTAWIPLGVMGQAPTALLTASGPMSSTSVIAVIFLVLAVPMAAWALSCQVRMVAHWPRFNPTWWSTTFPSATIGAASHQLAVNTGVDWLNDVSLALLGLLLINWLLATARFLQWGVRRDAAGR